MHIAYYSYRLESYIIYRAFLRRLKNSKVESGFEASELYYRDLELENNKQILKLEIVLS